MTTPMMKSIENTIVERLASVGLKGRLPRSRAWQARHIVDEAIRPHIPEGTMGWLASPQTGETARQYAARAVAVAVGRAQWAGGPRDVPGTDVVTPELVASVNRLLR